MKANQTTRQNLCYKKIAKILGVPGKITDSLHARHSAPIKTSRYNTEFYYQVTIYKFKSPFYKIQAGFNVIQTVPGLALFTQCINLQEITTTFVLCKSIEPWTASIINYKSCIQCLPYSGPSIFA